MMKRFPAVLALLCVTATSGAADTPPAPLTCLLAPYRVSQIGSDLTGIVSDVLVQRTSAVQAGQLLVQIDPRQAEAGIKRASILVANTRERLARARDLRAGNVISQAEMATYQAEYDLAEAELAQARIPLEQSRITAPFAGIVADIFIEQGELTSSDPLLRLIDTARLKAEMIFPSEAYGQIRPGDALRLTTHPGQSVTDAIVLTIDPFIDATSDSFMVVAEIDNASGLIPAGAGCALAPQ